MSLSIETYLKERIEVRQKEANDISVNITVEKRVKKEKQVEIISRIKTQLNDLKNNSGLSDYTDIERFVRSKAWTLIDKLVDKEYSALMLNHQEKRLIYDALIRNMFGLGILEPFLNDKNVNEIMINGPKNIFIEKKGVITRATDQFGHEIEFSSEKELRNIVDKIVAPINRKVDESDPIVDARLPDGSRVNIVLRSISLGGTTITIRKFPENPFTLQQLVEFGTLTEKVAMLLQTMVKSKYNIIVSGGTGSGKTTFLNALSMYIPSDERVITVEDSAELKFSQVENLVRLETKAKNIEGKGEISMRDLVKTSLRMRPDRIVIGEVRSGEALDMLQAMNTGHDGSLSTGHANSAADMLLRVETMVLMAGLDLPIRAIRQQIATAVDMIVHISKLRDGTRRVVEIIEVLDMEDGQIQTQSIFQFVENHENFQVNKVVGVLEHCGRRISNYKKFHSSGITNYEDIYFE